MTVPFEEQRHPWWCDLSLCTAFVGDPDDLRDAYHRSTPARVEMPGLQGYPLVEVLLRLHSCDRLTDQPVILIRFTRSVLEAIESVETYELHPDQARGIGRAAADVLTIVEGGGQE
jgi:hypothetical protein